MATYKGFSTIGKTKKFRLTDYELVKRDLLNHFYLRRGEKLMNPNFGSIIWDSLFEPFTDSLRTSISDDVKRIAAYEIRLTLDTIIITEFEHGMQLELEVTYLPTDQTELIVLRFDRESLTMTEVV
jgi:phage baseplate assembly protein W